MLRARLFSLKPHTQLFTHSCNMAANLNDELISLGYTNTG